MEHIIQKLKQFNSERDWDQFHTPENLSKSICIEAAELLESFQWSSDINIDNVKEELADVLIYSLILSYKMNFDVEDLIYSKIKKNELKYPVNKAKGNSKKYSEY